MRLRKFISSSLVVGLLFNNTSSLASVLSEDGRYETFEGNDITIDNVLEENSVDVEIEGNTMVNVANQKDPVPITKSYTVEGTNHIPLQGEYDGKARPIVEGNTLVNLFSINSTMVQSSSSSSSTAIWSNTLPTFNLVSGTVYTVIIKGNSNLSEIAICNGFGVNQLISKTPASNGYYINTFRYDDSHSDNRIYLYSINHDYNQDVIDNTDIMLIEGDLTSNPPTNFFEGVQSSFEDQLVTQEMIDSGQEDVKNLGKYKVEYKITGKNKFSGYGNKTYIKPNIAYKFSSKRTEGATRLRFAVYDINGNNVGENIAVENLSGSSTFYYNTGSKRFVSGADFSIANTGFILKGEFDHIVIEGSNYENLQLKEGYTETEYEPYKEYTKTFYLNSPLLDGDTIEEIDGKATHIKKYGIIRFNGNENWVLGNFNNTNTMSFDIKEFNALYKGGGYCNRFNNNQLYLTTHDFEYFAIGTQGKIIINISKTKLSTQDIEGFKEWLSENPITVVYELNTPTYETISDELILIDSYKDGHLDLNTNVPVNKVDFIPIKTNLKYLYPSTEYTVQFESDNTGKIDRLLLGDKILYNNYSVSKGINRFNITTPSEITSKELMLDGIGFNLSSLIVTQDVNEGFDYFEGIQSVGQDNKSGHSINIISSGKNLFNANHIVKDVGYVEIINRNSIKLEKESPNGWDYAVVRNFENYLDDKETYTLSAECSEYPYAQYGIDIIRISDGQRILVNAKTLTVNKDLYRYHLKFYFNSKEEKVEGLVTNIYTNIQLEKSNTKTSFVDFSYDEVVVNLNEPLRSLPNGVKDRIIKRNGQWVIERNCGEILLDGSEYWSLTSNGDIKQNTAHFMLGNFNSGKTVIINDRMISIDKSTVGLPLVDIDYECLYLSNNGVVPTLWLNIEKSKISSVDSKGLKEWLSNNPITVVYQLAEQVYEPLNVSPTVHLFKDVTHISNNSNIPANMKITVDRVLNRAYEAIEVAKSNPTMQNIAIARMWINLAGETLKKDEFQEELDSITDIVDLEIEKKTVTANMDIYVKSANMLSMSLNTNSITFEGYSGTSSLEMKDAVEISINSSLPYTLNASIESPIQNSDGTSVIPSDILNIKESTDIDYKVFSSIGDKIKLSETSTTVNEKMHKIDFKLNTVEAYKPDIYKTTIKFEAIQN